MKRQNQYDITIKFQTTGKNKILFNSPIHYLGSLSHTDQLKISQKEISIICKRTSVINPSEIFYNHNSSIYNQIIKALVYYYALNFNCPKIKQIIVTRKGAQGVISEKKLELKEIIQPVTNKIKSSVSFDPAKIKIIFEETEKGKVILIALSYWIKAMSSNDAVFTFERLWRGLNSIYSLIGGHGNETNCHIALRAFTIAHPEILVHALPEIEKYSIKNLRNSFRWRALILNDYPNQKNTAAFRDFILRYHDERIMLLMKETLPYRQDYLTRLHFIIDVNNHITATLAAPVKVNTELVSLLCIKYSYFIRNKSFHGEKIDGTFRLVENKEIKELEKLNALQSNYVSDLINSNQLF